MLSLAVTVLTGAAAFSPPPVPTDTLPAEPAGAVRSFPDGAPLTQAVLLNEQEQEALKVSRRYGKEKEAREWFGRFDSVKSFLETLQWNSFLESFLEGEEGEEGVEGEEGEEGEEEGESSLGPVAEFLEAEAENRLLVGEGYEGEVTLGPAESYAGDVQEKARATAVAEFLKAEEEDGSYEARMDEFLEAKEGEGYSGEGGESYAVLGSFEEFMDRRYKFEEGEEGEEGTLEEGESYGVWSEKSYQERRAEFLEAEEGEGYEGEEGEGTLEEGGESYGERKEKSYRGKVLLADGEGQPADVIKAVEEGTFGEEEEGGESYQLWRYRPSSEEGEGTFEEEEESYDERKEKSYHAAPQGLSKVQLANGEEQPAVVLKPVKAAEEGGVEREAEEGP